MDNSICYELAIATVSRSSKNVNALLESIDLPENFNWEFLLSWNGDAKPKIIEKTVHTTILYQPYNFSKNNNSLASKAKSRYILFVNDDIIFDEGALLGPLEVIKNRSEVGVVGINLRYLSGNSQHGGIFFDRDGAPYHRLKGDVNYLDPRLINNEVVPAVTGAFMLTRLDEFKHIRFNEDCLVAAQDIILCNEYKMALGKKCFYFGHSTAIHLENETRKLFDQKTTPLSDLNLMSSSYERMLGDFVAAKSQTFDMSQQIRLRVITEKEGWIMHRKGKEIADRIENSRINTDYPEANIHYYINYGYFNKRPASGICVANFTHFDSDKLADKWVEVAHEVDHCIAVCEEAAHNLIKFGVPQQKITVIRVGADKSFKPAMVLGLCGRVYPGGRKGEHLVHRLLEDSEVMDNLSIVASNETWSCPTLKTNTSHDFYSAIDFLLVTSLLEGGPVPFMEALAMGKLAIAPSIGVIGEFPHIDYEVGNYESLKKAILTTKSQFLRERFRLSSFMEGYNWESWAYQHIVLFQDLLSAY